MERDGPIEHASDWDSLSDRVKKARRQQKMILQQQKGKLNPQFFFILNFH